MDQYVPSFPMPSWREQELYPFFIPHIFIYLFISLMVCLTELLEYFDVLLTVHYSNDQFLFQLMHHNITLLTKSLYMFGAPTCPSSGGQTIHTPQLVQLHLKLNI